MEREIKMCYFFILFYISPNARRSVVLSHSLSYLAKEHGRCGEAYLQCIVYSCLIEIVVITGFWQQYAHCQTPAQTHFKQ